MTRETSLPVVPRRHRGDEAPGRRLLLPVLPSIGVERSKAQGAKAGEAYGAEPMIARVLGVDPGPTHTGWALLDFAIPSAPVWFGGGTCEEIEDVFDSFGARRPIPVSPFSHELGEPERLDLVCIERPRALHNPMANVQLMATAWAGGIVVGLARARGLIVQEVGQNEWRQALVGHSKRGEKVDPKVADHLRMHVRQMPERSSVHARDAAGVAIVGYRLAVQQPLPIRGHAREQRAIR